MIVCVCASISDRAIRAARDASATSVEAIATATGAGADCGCCAETIARILAEAPAAPCKKEPCQDCPRRGGPAEAARRPGPASTRGS